MIRGMLHVLVILNRPCMKNNPDISRELDNALPRATRIGLRLHYLLCKPCRRFRNQFRFLRTAASRLHESAAERALSSVRMPTDVRDRLRTRLGEL